MNSLKTPLKIIGHSVSEEMRHITKKYYNNSVFKSYNDPEPRLAKLEKTGGYYETDGTILDPENYKY